MYFNKLTVIYIGELDLYRLTDEEFIRIVDIYNKDKTTLDFAQEMDIGIDMMFHTTSRQYTIPLKEEITELKQENKKLKEDIKKLKLQDQALQNSFNQLLELLLKQNLESKDQFQKLLVASDDISKQTGKSKEHTFGD